MAAVLPAWALGLVAWLSAAAASEEPAGEAVLVQGPKPVESPKETPPAEDGLDLDKQLRGLDLYQPTPNPERPVPFSGSSEERRRHEAIARALAPDAQTPFADIIAASEDKSQPLGNPGVARVVAAASTHEEATDEMMMSASSAGDGESWRLLGLAGLALWPWPSCGFQFDGEAQPERRRKRGRIGDDTTGSRTTR